MPRAGNAWELAHEKQPGDQGRNSPEQRRCDPPVPQSCHADSYRPSLSSAKDQSGQQWVSQEVGVAWCAGSSGQSGPQVVEWAALCGNEGFIFAGVRAG